MGKNKSSFAYSVDDCKLDSSTIKIFKDSYEAHMNRKNELEKKIDEKKKNHKVVGDAEIYQLGFSSGIVSALTDIYLKTK